VSTRTAAYENYEGDLLNRFHVDNQSISGTGGTHTFNIEVGGNASLVLEVDLVGSADGDLVVQVNPVAEDGQVYPLIQPPVQFIGPTHNAGIVYYWALFDVSAQQRVQVKITNNNAGAQNCDYSWRLA
jgi:hypothetical protein